MFCILLLYLIFNILLFNILPIHTFSFILHLSALRILLAECNKQDLEPSHVPVPLLFIPLYFKQREQAKLHHILSDNLSMQLSFSQSPIESFRHADALFTNDKTNKADPVFKFYDRACLLLKLM